MLQYERGMAPAEQKIAGKLRQQLTDLSAKSHQVQFGIPSMTKQKQKESRGKSFCKMSLNMQSLYGNHKTLMIGSVRDVFNY